MGSAWWRRLAAGFAGSLPFLLMPVAFAHHQHYVSCRPIPGVCENPPVFTEPCPDTNEFHCVLAPGACDNCVVASVAEAGARPDSDGSNCAWNTHDDIVVTCVELPVALPLPTIQRGSWGSAGGSACTNGNEGNSNDIYVKCNPFWWVMTGVGHRNDGGCETDAWIPFCGLIPNGWTFGSSGTPVAVGVHGWDGGSQWDFAEAIIRTLTPPASPVTCSASPSSVGIGETVTLTASSQSQGTFTWSTGVGGNPPTGTGQTLDVTYATVGQKTINVTQGSSTGACSVTVSEGEPWCSIQLVGPEPTSFGVPFTVAWSNAPNLSRITSLGWQTVDELGVPATGILVPQPGAGTLPACPPQASTFCQWGGLTFMREGTASVTVEVENQSNVVRTCNFSYTFDCGPTSGHPLDPVTKAIEDALAALRAFNPNFVNVIQPVSLTDPIYSWHDNRGWHHIKVEVKDGNVNTPGHPFIYIPRMKAKSSFFKKCVIVKYAQQTVRVIVTRYDQDNAASRHWAMRYRTNAASPEPCNPSDPACSIQFGIRSISKVRHGYKPNSVWIVEDHVTK